MTVSTVNSTVPVAHSAGCTEVSTIRTRSARFALGAVGVDGGVSGHRSSAEGARRPPDRADDDGGEDVDRDGDGERDDHPVRGRRDGITRC